MLTRTHSWAIKELHDFLLSNYKTAFKWGVFDCCLFASSAIQSFTGVDIASEFRGKYTTKLGASKAIKSITGGTTAEDAVAYVANKHGLVEYQHPLCAKRGDLVVFNNSADVIAGIVHLTGRHVISVSEEGLVKLPITSIKRAWSV